MATATTTELGRACRKCGADEWGRNNDKRSVRGYTLYCIACRTAYRIANPDKIAKANAAYRAANREQKAVSDIAWRQTNADKNAATSARRRALKLNQTPPDANHGAIEVFYTEAKRLELETGIPHHVDHIHPLSKGGLHHEDNLQILTAEENMRKGARVLT